MTWSKPGAKKKKKTEEMKKLLSKQTWLSELPLLLDKSIKKK